MLSLEEGGLMNVDKWKWYHSHEKLPEEGQAVYYVFAPMCDIKPFVVEGYFDGDGFYSKRGFCDRYDAPVWRAREEPKEEIEPEG